MRVAILGFGLEGQASYDYYRAQGAEITICDQNDQLQVPDGTATQLGPNYVSNLDQFDVLVRSAGLPTASILTASPGVADKLTTGTNEFFAHCPTRHIIGVTGTKGKGTTSTLITKMLEAAGHKVHLGGNIGVPALALLPQIQPEDWVVLELSSFQLSDLKYSPPIAVCLMVVPEHLNWHTDLADYTHAKQHIFAYQTTDDIAIYLPDNAISTELAQTSAGRQLPYFAEPGAHVADGQIVIDGQIICRTDELKLLGKHNWQNVCAAITAAWQVTQDVAALRSVLTSFSGLEHRLEFVREVASVQYYDDSFGTTPETAIVALESFDQPKVIILGGSDKGATYGELSLAVMQNNVRAAVIIGMTGPKIAEALKLIGFTNVIEGGQTMSEIVNKARAAAQPGDVVLLSTGCASFGLFHDYKDRGNQFKQVVTGL